MSRVYLANEEKTQYMLLCLPERFDLLGNKPPVNTVADIRGYGLSAGEFSDIVNNDFDETKLNSFLITEPFDCELTITLKGRSILAESPAPVNVGGVSYSVQGNQIETYLTNHK